ncbi:hypothetical protein COC42_04330 [Sphingomonas spermidinifaciens]|uniref:Uncharacterized protein n=1 Tax=Sphingomonas spermidinifaciens TaxID=1141889 RepID=A0A2A4B760_9SPHN|nr:hypothetical protein [Sphingomonas spermidinifaciens]PCD03598.1 hypothetical protein COC42_04330 [Sphingomonas spermidinifaciens]
MIASLLFVTLAAPAQGYATRDLGPWKVAAARDGDGCFMTRSYPRDGDTTLLFGLSADGSNRLTVLNANWSIKPRDRLTLDYRLSNRRFPRQLAIGLAAGDKQGFVSTFDAKFPAQFAAATSLAIFRGEVPVERLTLEGTGVAVAELRRCVAASKGAPAARDAGDEAIPRDPFADSQPKRRK